MTLGSHQRCVGDSQDWITPKWIIDELGPFDLDPAAAWPCPWVCARRLYTIDGNGLDHSWFGRVWLNPPFDRYEVGRWIERLAAHGRGTALLHARTETDWFSTVWQHAAAILLLRYRLHFYYPDGRRAEANSGAPACLVAFGRYDAQRLKASSIEGVLLEDWKMKGGGKPKKMPPAKSSKSMKGGKGSKMPKGMKRGDQGG